MEKISVIILNKQIDKTGIIANASFVLGLTAGREIGDETFGSDVTDGDKKTHKYLTKIGHFVRKAGQSKLRSLRNEFAEHSDVLLIDYTEDADPSDYREYQKQIKEHSGEEIIYRAIHLYGPKEKIIPKTKNLSAL